MLTTTYSRVHRAADQPAGGRRRDGDATGRTRSIVGVDGRRPLRDRQASRSTFASVDASRRAARARPASEGPGRGHHRRRRRDAPVGHQRDGSGAPRRHRQLTFATQIRRSGLALSRRTPAGPARGSGCGASGRRARRPGRARCAAACSPPLSAACPGCAARVARRRRARLVSSAPARRCRCIVVGNLIVGGAGKTPLVIAHRSRCCADARLSRPASCRAATAARGDGASRRSPSTPRRATRGRGRRRAAAARARTGVPVVGRHATASPRRARCCRAIPTSTSIVSDDGLQHSALARDIEIAGVRRARRRQRLAAAGRAAARAVPTRSTASMRSCSTRAGAAHRAGRGHRRQRRSAGVTALADLGGAALAPDVGRARSAARRAASPRSPASRSRQRFFAMLRGARPATSTRMPLPDHHAFDAACRWPARTLDPDDREGRGQDAAASTAAAGALRVGRRWPRARSPALLDWLARPAASAADSNG